MRNRAYVFFAVFAFLLLSFVLLLFFGITWLPLACLLLGFVVRVAFRGCYLEIFSFLIPILPALAVLENKGFPLNYLLLPLFFLCGIVAGEWLAGKGKVLFPHLPLPRHYSFLLLLLGVSFFFVMLRWSNLTLSPLAFLSDTLVAPTGQRLSFAIVFPVVELALFTLTPLYFLLLARSADRCRVLIAFLCGQSVSILFSLFQRLQERGPWALQLGGLASDPTAFGFLSALAVLLASYLVFHFGRKWLGLLFIFIAMTGILNSATRVGLLAIFAVLVIFILLSRNKFLGLTALAIFLTASLAVYLHFFHRLGPNFLIRLQEDFKAVKQSFQKKKADPFLQTAGSNPRYILWHYSLECLRAYPLSGVGPGNFVFVVMANHRDKFLHHLPANQYFFVATSIGLIGMLAFLLFCFGLFRQKKGPEKWLWGIFLFLLIFNDYLWFSEIFLVFWLFASLGEEGGEKPSVSGKRMISLYACALLLFVAFNLMTFSKLHPKTWAQQAGTSYEYGFFYQEKAKGKPFRWSGGKAGVYVFLDKDNPRALYQLTCGAPLSRLPGKKQAVDIFWRGRLYRRVTFRDLSEYSLLLQDGRHSEGFLEFRVHPAFNLKKLGLGEESRDLGIQVRGPGI